MKRLVSLAVGLALLAAIYWWIDLGKILDVFAAVDLIWLSAALAMLVPPLILTAVRLQRMVPKTVGIGFAESMRLILSASVLNVFLPSKAGDLAKSWFFRQRGHLSGGLALALVLFEKACDMLALLAWCAFGLLVIRESGLVLATLTAFVIAGIVFGIIMLASIRFSRFAFGWFRRLLPAPVAGKIANIEESWVEMHAYFWSDRRRLGFLSAASVGIWLLHLVSVWLFIRALGVNVPLVDSLALTPLSILAGLLPLTFAGVGTRDAAVLFFYRDYLSAPEGAAVGVFLTFRYLVLAVAGLPFIGDMTRQNRD